MTTNTIKTIGTSGRDFTTIGSFCTWLHARDLVANDEMVYAYVYNNQSGGYGDLSPLTADATHYCIVQPAPGLGVEDLDTSGALDYGTLGIQLIIQIDSAFNIGMGCSVQGFRVSVPYQGTGYLSSHYAIYCRKTNSAVTSTICEFKYNRVLTEIDTGYQVLAGGNGSTTYQVRDNLFIQDSGAGYFINQGWVAAIERNTFVRRGTAGTGVAISTGGISGTILRDNVFVGCGSVPVTAGVSPSTSSNNYNDVAITGYSTGFTINSSLVTSVNDLRPASGGGLIQTGSSAASGTFDVREAYRGVTPDAGASQFSTPTLPPVPVGTITSQTVTGETIVISGNATNSPTSGSVTLTASSSPNGAVTVGPTVVTVTGSTFTVTLSNVTPGNYNSPAVTFTNYGGTGSASSGGSAVTVLPPPTAAITSQTVTNQSVTISGTTTGTPTSGSITLPASGSPNGAVTVGPTAVTLGTNTFTVTLNNVSPGNYSAPVITFVNASGTSPSATGGTSLTVNPPPIPTGTITSETANYNIITISGTTTNIPASGSVTLPAASSNPNGAVTVSPTAVTIGSGTFTVTLSGVTPGNYAAPVITFTNISGTGAAATGGTAITATTPPPVPVGTITSQVVTAQSITISGTTTNTPTSGSVTLPVGGTPNGAVAIGPVSVTLGTNTFTVTIPNITPGNYAAPSVTFTNAGGTSSAASGGTTYTVSPPPTCTITAQSISGNSVTVSGTTTGTPTSGSITLTASSSPNGAVTVGPTAVTLGSGTFTVTLTNVTPGNYNAPTVTVTNSNGTSSAATGGSTVLVLSVPTAIPGATIKTIGPGRDYATVALFAAYLNTQNMTTNGLMLYAYVYEDQIAASTNGVQLKPLGYDSSHYCIIKPAPGLSVNDIDTSGVLGYGSLGVQLNLTVGNGLQIGQGVSVQGFKINIPNVANSTDRAIIMSKYTQTTSSPDTISELRYNRVYFTGGVSNKAIDIGGSANPGQILDNLFISDSGTGLLINNQWSPTIKRNTFVRTGASAGNPAINNSGYGGAVYTDNVFIGCSSTPIILNSGAAIATSSNNFADTTITNGLTGFTVNTGANALIAGSTDFRPTSSGPLIGAASASAVSTNDIRGNNRGLTPDVGVVQLNPATPLPTGTITSLTIAGQNITISGTTTNTPTSGSATLPPSSTSNGAQIVGPTVVSLSTNAFSFTWTNVSPGNYNSPIVTFTNAGGTSAAANGGSAVNILGISGSPIAPAGSGGGGAVTPTVTILSQVITNRNTLTITGTTTNTPTSGAVTVATGGTPNGAVAISSTSLTLDTGTFTVVLTNIHSGNYAAPSITVTNSAGTSSVASGGTTFTIATAPAPTVTISNSTLAGAVLTANGAVNMQGDNSGTLSIYIDQQYVLGTLGPYSVTPVNGLWSYSTTLGAGIWRIRAVASANGLATTISSNVLIVESISGVITLRTS